MQTICLSSDDFSSDSTLVFPIAVKQRMNMGGTPLMCGVCPVFVTAVSTLAGGLGVMLRLYVLSCVGVRKHRLAPSIGLNKVCFNLRTEAESSVRNVVLNWTMDNAQ